jgi:predicted amidophosphoribosyltransferase
MPMPRRRDDDTVPCPYCQAPIYEDRERCPQCGNYLSEEDAPAGRPPLWIVIGTVAALAVALLWVLGM